MPEEDNQDVEGDEICEVHACDEFLDVSVFFGGYPRVNTALDDIHLDRADLECWNDKILDDVSAGRRSEDN